MENNKTKREPYVVLVGMDYSELANRALEEALDLAARRDDAEIHVVHVVAPTMPSNGEPAFVAGYVRADGIDPLDGALERLRVHVQVRLETFIASVAHRSGNAADRVISHVRLDTPEYAISQLASELNASLIVVGTHGRRGLSRMLMGSVAETTLRYARCPVLVIPPLQEIVEVKIDPPCPECLRTRADSNNQQLWCAQHRQRHGRRHTYHQADRTGDETNFPLVLK